MDGILIVFGAGSTVVGLCAVLAALYYSLATRQAQRSMVEIVRGQGITSAEEVVRILTDFPDNQERVQALQKLMSWDPYRAQETVEKIQEIRARTDALRISIAENKLRMRFAGGSGGVLLALGLGTATLYSVATQEPIVARPAPTPGGIQPTETPTASMPTPLPSRKRPSTTPGGIQPTEMPMASMPTPLPSRMGTPPTAAGTPAAQFPWPPPRASAFYVFPWSMIPGHATILGTVSKTLEGALDGVGYTERSYFVVPGGFALVTQLEAIEPDGTPRKPPNRWVPEEEPLSPSTFTVTRYISALFHAAPGYYRVIAFVITAYPFGQTDQIVTRKLAKEWLATGTNSLPPQVRKEKPQDGLTCTALIYEFHQAGAGESTSLSDPSLHPGREHLERSQIIAALSVPTQRR